MATIVETGFGRLEGFESDGVRVFRGIPYARPPVGERRFRAPEKPEPWTGVRDATCFGPVAPQPPLMLAALPGFDVGEQSEDCLYLNVYSPSDAGPSKRKPVMVWIHGGAFVIGAGSQSIYDGRKLVRRGDVVLVTINYRLGVFGFLDLGQPERATPNAGILDQIAALEWVRDHIDAFGGDPGQVTIFGESAGGMSVGTLLGCPAAQGLFQRAVPQSGSCQAVHDHESSAAVTTAILAGLGMSTPHVQHLREVPVDRLMQVQQMVSMQLMMVGGSQLLPFCPVVDGHVLPRHPMDEIREGISSDVQLLVGSTRDEWRLFGFMDPQVRNIDMEQIAERIQSRLPHADGAKIAAGYRETRPDLDLPSLWLAIETDRVFRIPALRIAEAQLAHQAEVFVYLYTWESPGFGGLLGACHAIEIPFLFGCLDLPGADKFIGAGPEAERLVEHTMDAWLRFARVGDPSHDGIGAWTRYDEKRRATMELGARCGLLDDPAGAERVLWDGVL